MRRILPVLLLGLAGLGSFFVAQSGAQADSKPAPSCAGVAASDPNNDAVSDPIGAPGGVTAGPAPDNLEVTRLWFDRQGAKTTANIEVKNLTKANTTNASSISWYVTWTGADDTILFVNAESDGSTVTYQYGTLTENLYSTEGDTTGKLFEGPQGVVQIVIPNASGGSVGSKITEPYATSTENYTVPGVGSLLANDDNAPDSGGGKSWTVVDCPATGGGPTGPTGPGGPGSTATPGPSATASPGPGGGPGGGGTIVQPGALNVKAKAALGSAKKAKKKRKATVKLTGNATNIDATLYKGSFTKPKVYGRGKVAKLAGKAKLKLKLSKKVKKGSFALTLIGTNPDGARAEKTFKVKFKK